MLVLPQTRWKDVLEKNKVAMIKRPVAEWARHLEKLTCAVSELKTDAITMEEVMAELSNKFGTVQAMTQYQECMSPKSRSSLALS